MKKTKYRIISILFILALSARFLLAQDPPDPGWGDPVGVPLDGGLLSVLLAGGIGLYLRKRKKSKE